MQIRVESAAEARPSAACSTDSRDATSAAHRLEAVVVNEGGHGFYRVRYSRELLERLLGNCPTASPPSNGSTCVNDAWAAAIAGLMPLTEYLDLTARFRDERDRNVWIRPERIVLHA